MLPIGDQNIKGKNLPYVTYGLLLLNVLVFIYEASLSPSRLELFIFTYGTIPEEIQQGQDLYTLFTSMFLHGGFMHLFGNMLYLWIFGDNIEAVVGSWRFLVFYILGGLFASLSHIMFNLGSTIPSVGASGAIAAVMGAYIMMFPGSRIRTIIPPFFIFQIPAYVFLGFWIGMQILSGVSSEMMAGGDGAGVAYWAHIGGFLYGVLYGMYYKKQAGQYYKPESSPVLRRYT